MNNDEAYAYAWDHAEQNPDGSRVESSIIALLAQHVQFDVDKAKLGLARRILARRKRPGQTAPAGEVVFPGMEHYAYEPHRVLADNDGNVIENAAAPIRYKTAEAKRAQEDAKKAFDRQSREQNEANHFAEWAADELAKGRHPREVTWDNCVRETGLWKDVQPEVEPEANDDEDDLP